MIVREPRRERMQSSLPTSSQRICQRMSTHIFSSMCHSSSLLLGLFSLTRFIEAPPPITTVALPASHTPSPTMAHPLTLNQYNSSCVPPCPLPSATHHGSFVSLHHHSPCLVLCLHTPTYHGLLCALLWPILI